MTRQKLLQLAWEVLIHPLFSSNIATWIYIYFGVYKILLMEKISIPWKTAKVTLEQFFAQKYKKVLGKWNCEVA